MNKPRTLKDILITCSQAEEVFKKIGILTTNPTNKMARFNFLEVLDKKLLEDILQNVKISKDSNFVYTDAEKGPVHEHSIFRQLYILAFKYKHGIDYPDETTLVKVKSVVSRIKGKEYFSTELKDNDQKIVIGYSRPKNKMGKSWYNVETLEGIVIKQFSTQDKESLMIYILQYCKLR